MRQEHGKEINYSHYSRVRDTFQHVMESLRVQHPDVGNFEFGITYNNQALGLTKKEADKAVEVLKEEFTKLREIKRPIHSKKDKLPIVDPDFFDAKAELAGQTYRVTIHVYHRKDGHEPVVHNDAIAAFEEGRAGSVRRAG